MSKKRKLPRIVHKNILEKDNVVGWAYLDGSRIELDPSIYGKEYLDTLIHESTHIFFPYLSEKIVDEFSKFVTEILWKQKYRKKVKKV